MAHRALVIGVDDYVGQANLKLHGAVADAVSITKWLVDPAGGAVPPANVALLTSPALEPVPPQLSGVVCIGSATCQTINQQLIDLPDKAADPDDRLYFYFSGHGLTAPTDIAQEAILPADFTIATAGVAMGIRSILEWLKTSKYNQQFVFIDACRNAIVSQRFLIGGFSLVPELTRLRAQVEQFVYMSTSRGLTAAEAQVIGNTRAGVFTQALVDGLRGAGNAKLYNVARLTYEVTSSSVLPYLVNRVRTQIAKLMLPNGADPTAFLQTPTLSGERFSDPVICSFSRDCIDEVTLTLHVDPSEAWPASTLLVERDDVEVHKVPAPLNGPCRIKLAPKEYSVTANASSYTSTPSTWPLNLYEDTELAFTMTAAVHSSAAAAGASLSPVPLVSCAPAHLEMRIQSGPSSPAEAVIADSAPPASSAPPSTSGTASLTVTTADDSSPLEIECTGKERLACARQIVTSGTHSITATLSPGIYVARLRAPNGRCVEKLVNLLGGAQESIALEPPKLSETDLIAALAGDVGFTSENGAMQLSDSSGLTSLAWVRLSTILSAAATAQVLPAKTLTAQRLRSLGLNTLQNVLDGRVGSALQVLFGDELPSNTGAPSPPTDSGSETAQHAELTSISVACFSLDALRIEEERSPTILPGFQFIAEHSLALEPGCYWLSIRDPGSPGTFIPVTISKDRVTNLVFTRNVRGRVSIFVYQPSANSNARKTMQSERRAEMAQRYLMSGQMGDAGLLSAPPGASPNVNELLVGGSSDPIVGLLGAFLSLHSVEAGRPQASPKDPATLPAVETMGEYLPETFPYFPDSHVLKAEIQMKQGRNAAARDAVHRALEAGVPIFDDGLLRLCKLIDSLVIEHPRTSLIRNVLQNRIPGMLWTVCSLKDPAKLTLNSVPAPAAWA